MNRFHVEWVLPPDIRSVGDRMEQTGMKRGAEECNAGVVIVTGIHVGRRVGRGQGMRAHWESKPFGSDPDEVEGRVEIGDL